MTFQYLHSPDDCLHGGRVASDTKPSVAGLSIAHGLRRNIGINRVLGPPEIYVHSNFGRHETDAINCLEMTVDDASWLNDIASFGDDTTADELLAVLLGDGATCHDASVLASPSRSLRRRALSPTSSSSSSSTDKTSTAASPPPTKRKRKRERVNNYRPKEQIDRLRRAVADLENLLALTRQRTRIGRTPPLLIIDQAKRAQYSPNEVVWMDVATRQYNYMREAQILNEQLRAQVLNQMQIVRGLTRLARRALCGIPSELIPRALADANAGGFSSKRQELLAKAVEMYDSIEKVFGSDPFESTTEELSDSTTYRYEDYVIPPRAPLASGYVRRYAPHSVADVSNLLWLLDAPSERGKETFQVEHFEEAADRQIVQGTIRIGGNSQAKCVIVRRLRVWDSTRHSIVFASSLWPNPENPSPWNFVGMDTKQWIDVRDSQTLGDGGRLTEVRTTMEACKLSDAPLSMAPFEATRLQEFVFKTVEFSMNYMQHKLDGMLLSSSNDVFEAT